MKYLKPYNESIRHLLKPKKLEDVKNDLLKLKPIDVLIKIKQYDLYHLFNKDEIKELMNHFSNKYHYIIDYKLYDYFTDDELLEYIKMNNSSFEFILKNGVYLDRIGLVEYALSNNVNINDIGNLFIKLGVFYLKTTNNILEFAISKRNIDIIKLLLDYGVNITKESYNICRILKRNDIKKLLDKYNKTNESIRHLLKSKNEKDIEKSIEKLTPEQKLYTGCDYGILSLVKDAIENDKVILNGMDHVIYITSIHNHIDVVEYLLKNTKVDPTIYNNASIENAYIENNYEMVKLLLNDDRVRNSLPKFKVNDYETFLDTFNKSNESIKHLLKPKSEEDIIKLIKGLTDKDKFILSCEYDIDWLFDELVNSEKLTIDDYLDGLYYSIKRENLNVIDKIFNIKGFLQIIDEDIAKYLIYKSIGKSALVVNYLIKNPYITEYFTQEELNEFDDYVKNELF